MKKTTLIVIILAVIVFVVSPVRAEIGTIRIAPSLPVTVVSPVAFEIWVEREDDPTYDPCILLVMTYECWVGLTGETTVSWSGGSVSFSKGDFDSANSGYIPLLRTSEGGRYSVYSLKSYLGVDVGASLYWVAGGFLSEPLHASPHQTFTVTLRSSSPRMLVYAIGKTISPCRSDFNNRVLPSFPGFVVPEPSIIFLTLASFVGFGLYALKRKKL